MRRVPRSMAVLSTAVLAAGLLAACGGGDDGGDSPGGRPAGEIIVRGCNPENPLVPGNTAETCGGNVLDVTTSKLIHYNNEDAAPEMDIAESIETDDNQNFTITLKDGYTFSDGSPITAESFVKAWNYTAYGPNGYQGSYFFEPIEGYADLQCTGPEDDPCSGKGKPATDEMTGLKVVDEATFTVKTTQQVSNLPVRLGYSAFAPMPETFFEDPENYGTAGTTPVSSGPYKVEEYTQNKQIVLVKNENYQGEYAGESDKITFKVYNNDSAAYQDAVAGNIDVIDLIPTDNLTDDAWLDDFEDRGTSREQGVIQLVGMNPTVDKRLDDPDLRTAISMSIDRETITEQIFAGSATPADGWVSPVVDGYVEGQCQGKCVFDPEAAKALFEKANGPQVLADGLTLTYNGDGGHEAWTEAACNSIRQTLGVECVPEPTVDFATFLTGLDEEKTKGLFRYGWQMDYPSIENFLTPIYSKGAASNYFDYNDPQFQELLSQAAAAETLDEANALYQEAELQLAEDMRVIPLWYTTGHVAWSDRVENVSINAFGVPVYAEITTTG